MMAAKGVLFKLPPICRYTACSPPSGLNEGAPPFRLLPAAIRSACTPCQVDSMRCYLAHFRRDSVAGGQREMLPGTLLQGYRVRWSARNATWNAFVGKPCQVDSMRCYLEHFCRDTVSGEQQGDATWHAFAGIPCQVGSGKRHLARFCRDSVRWLPLRSFRFGGFHPVVSVP